jgi:hypothetical protein
LREPQQIGLREFAFLRRVVRHGAKQQADGVAAGAFHGRVNGVGGIFRGKPAGRFHRWRQVPDQTERVCEFFGLWRQDGRVAVFLGRIPAIGDQRRNQAGQDGIDFAIRQRIYLNPFHPLLPELPRPPSLSRAFCRLVRF